MLLPHYRTIREELSRLRRLRMNFVRKPPLKLQGGVLFLFSVLIAAGVAFFLKDTQMPRETTYMAGIFVLAALLWVTEALPLFATALLVIALEIILLADPGGWEAFGFEQGPSPDYWEFLAPIADPIIVLFFGGFLLARAATKEGVDQAMAGLILRLFQGKPLLVMLGLMIVTALFSMFMSNTATTAMMITLVGPMLGQTPRGAPLRKALVLSVPFAANIGGMGTPIASPPNAVAVGFLREAGLEISFLEWMLVAVPLMIGLLLVTWLLLAVLFRSDTKPRLTSTVQKIDGRGWYVVLVFVLTVGLWLSEGLHGLPTAVVAQLPILAFTATGILNRDDVNSLNWDILLLIAGGLALGLGIQRTGLDRFLVEALPAGGRTVLITLVLATLLLSTFMSNTAAANLLLPVGISFAGAAGVAGGPGIGQLGISIALVASASMALPISTPPNAIAYAQGEFQTRDIALAGSLVGLLTVILILVFGGPIVAFWLQG